MQAYPLLLLAVVKFLPESPRWFMDKNRVEDASNSLQGIFGEEAGKERAKELVEIHEQEQKEKKVGYVGMLTPGNTQFHPTIITIMGQVNQALTGYGCVSVYGPQIFEVISSTQLIHAYIYQ